MKILRKMKVRSNKIFAYFSLFSMVANTLAPFSAMIPSRAFAEGIEAPVEVSTVKKEGESATRGEDNAGELGESVDGQDLSEEEEGNEITDEGGDENQVNDEAGAETGEDGDALPEENEDSEENVIDPEAPSILEDGATDYNPANDIEEVVEVTEIPTPVVEPEVVVEDSAPSGLVEPETPVVVETKEKEYEYLEDGAEVVDSVEEDWNVDGEVAQTVEKVKLGIKYIFPVDEEVSVTFKKLPKLEEDRAYLKIERVKVDDLELPDDFVTDAEYAFDITIVDENGEPCPEDIMKNGEDFEYELTLPKPEGTEAEISYIEKSIDDAKNNEIKVDEIKPIEESKVEQQTDVVKATSIDHFTLFIVSNGVKLFVSGSLDGKVQVTVNPGQSIRVDLKVKGDSGDKWKSSSWQTEGGSINCVNHEDINVSEATANYSVDITAPSSNGTYGINFVAYTDDNCSLGASNTFTLTNGIIVDSSYTPPNVVLDYDSGDPIALSSVTGIWTSVSGGSYITGLQTNEVKWGSGNYGKSGLRFDGSGLQSFSTGDNFYLGALTHFNYPIQDAANGATLKITLEFEKPNISPNPEFSFFFNIDETSNLWYQCPTWQESNTPCDDRITFPSIDETTSFTIGDISYTLRIQGFVDSYPSGNPVSSFITEENRNNTAFLVGSLSSVLVERPEIRLTKKTNDQDITSGPGQNLYIGDPVTWQYIIQNSGNVVLTNVTISDNPVANIDCDPQTGGYQNSGLTLASGATMTCTASGTVASGQFSNTAIVTGTTPANTSVTASDTSWYNGVSRGSIKIVKNSEGGDATFSFTSNFGVSSLTTSSGTASQTVNSITPGTSYSISENVPSGWRLDSASCDKGTINAIEVVSGETTTCTFTNTKLNPLLSLSKSGSWIDGDSDGYADVGETIHYTFSVKNEGNMTLTNVVVIDTKATVSGGPTTLDVGETDSTTFTASYTITQADIDLGKVDNKAIADSNESGTAESTKTVSLPQNPLINVTKSANVESVGKARDVISYTIKVENTGTQTLTGVSVNDPMLSNEDCDSLTAGSQNTGFTINVGGTLTCVGTYTVTQADINNNGGGDGYIDNTVTVDSDQTSEYTASDKVAVIRNPVKIVATKIVCDSESDLPNWGNGGGNITENTASNWLVSNSACHPVQGWKFQWGDDKDANPSSDTYLEEATGWTTFDPTDANGQAIAVIDDFGSTGYIKVREVLQEGYIPFTYITNNGNSNNVSAEIYCDTDVLNYDNDDRINNPQYGETYYCVAWNALKKGNLEVTKTVNWTGITPDTNRTFEICITGPSYLDKNCKTADYDGGTLVWNNLVSGNYTVVETDPGFMWSITGSGSQINVGFGTTATTHTVVNTYVPYCGDGIKNQDTEQCDGLDDGMDGIDSIKEGLNFCTPTCKLIPIYDGGHSCTPGTTPVKVGDDYILQSKDSSGISVSLNKGQEYLFEISGTYHFGSGENRLADAAYGTETTWSSTVSDLGIWGTTHRGVLSALGDLGDGFGVIEWDNDKVVDGDHTYQKVFTPKDDMSARFVISDWYSNWYGNSCDEQRCMSDNSGSLELKVYECQPASEVTICKTDGKSNLPNWRVALIGDSVGSFSVPSNGSFVSENYPTGSYVVKASGTYNYGSETMNADAANAFRYAGLSCSGGVDGWVNGDASSCLNHYLNLNPSLTNGPTEAGWGNYYNPSHQYYKTFTGGDLNLKIWDSCGTSGEGCYGDNEGSLDVTIYKGYAGDTGEDGCVTFNNVPYGKYSIEETMQDGWRNVSGLDKVTIDESTENFHIVNELDVYDIHGYKWNDQDSDSNVDEGESKLAGWTINLYRWKDEAFENEAFKTTVTSSGAGDDLGWYWFEDLLSGRYKICEVKKNGWKQTFPVNESGNCHIVDLPDSNPNGYSELANFLPEPAPTYNFGNKFITPTASIAKWNDSTAPEKVGNQVLFTIKVTVHDNDVENAYVYDLFSEGFEYVEGSWAADSSDGRDLKALGIISEPVYASPAGWYLGDLKEGEVVTLTYLAEVTEEVEPGIYKDLAWIQGEDLLGSSVLGYAGSDGNIGDDHFVGTEVEVIAEIALETETDVKEEEEEGEVLGASTELPATGARTIWVTLLIALASAGVLLLLVGGLGTMKKDKEKIMKKGKKAVLGLLALGFVTLFSYKSYAASTVVRLSEPKSPIGDEFDLVFVAMDINDPARELTAKCFVQKPGEADFSDTPFHTEVISSTKVGDSRICSVGETILTDEGSYSFIVKVTPEGGSEVESNKVTVDYDGEGPDKPKYIEKEKVNDCVNKITLKTADDGETSSVKVYADDDKEIDIDDSHKIETETIGPDEKFEFEHIVTGDDCDKTWYYAVVAFDDAGNASTPRSEVITTTTTTTEEGEKETEEETGAIPVEGGAGIAEEGATAEGGEGAEGEGGTETGQPVEVNVGENEEGSVLGEKTGEEGKNIFKSPWFWIGLVVLGIVIIGATRKKKA